MERSRNQLDDFFVIGTDTGVGKSVVSLLLMRHFHDQGLRPFYLKPFQTGCVNPYDADSDARFVYSHVDALRGGDPAESVVYCFPEPKAPFFAARNAHKPIDINQPQAVLSGKRLEYAPVVLEAAGGLMVPITETALMIDIVAATDARPVLVARAGLGTINHTLLSLKILKQRGTRTPAIVFVDASQTPTPDDMVRENIEAVEKFSGIRVSGVIQKIDDFSNPPEYCRKIVQQLTMPDQG